MSTMIIKQNRSIPQLSGRLEQTEKTTQFPQGLSVLDGQILRQKHLKNCLLYHSMEVYVLF